MPKWCHANGKVQPLRLQRAVTAGLGETYGALVAQASSRAPTRKDAFQKSTGIGQLTRFCELQSEGTTNVCGLVSPPHRKTGNDYCALLYGAFFYQQ